MNINVTKSFLPPIEEYETLLDGIWKSSWLTNNGPLLNDLESKLKGFLRLDHLAIVNNGTIALQLAIKSLELKGEIITTPFSYVATASSIFWEGCTPVFADIDPNTFNLNPREISKAITKKTTAILATHVYGNPCEVEMIHDIAKANNLKVIYDGAHAFGTFYHGKSIFEYGDISTASFHSTKLFHMVEGGAVVTKDKELLEKIAWLRNFGHNGPEAFHGCGINGKNSELHAAMGLCVIKYIEYILERRKKLSIHYKRRLEGLDIAYQRISNSVEYNNSYFPIIFENEDLLLKSVKILNENSVFPRRYFYPSLNRLPYVNYVNCPVSENISKRVLCLPLYPDLREEEIDLIAGLLHRAKNQKG
ncbi:aminotransferase [Cytophagales bacterium WSM2-2]|nr:aminotransferase [Cytophagales bacterium WSM2-2]